MMATVCFLGEDLSVLYGPIDGMLSLVWEESYNTCGSFSLQLPFTKDLFAAAGAAAYLSVSDRPGLGRVEKIRVQTSGGTHPGEDRGTDSVGGAVYDAGFRVSGRMAESLLSDRVIPRGTRITGALVSAVLDTVSRNACAAAGARAIPRLVLGESDPLTDAAGVSIDLEDAPGGRALDEWVRSVLEPVGASYRILPDYAAGTLVFSVYRGLDRTQGQTENTPCVFSTSFASVGALTFVSDTGDYRNFAYIAGEGEGADRVVETLDLRTDPQEPLRELYVDARDLRSDDGGTVMSAAAYRNLLLARGRERLHTHRRILEIEGDAAPTVASSSAVTTAMQDTLPPIGYRCTQPFVADVDFALGDRCDIASEALGMTWSERIAAITYTYESGVVTAEAHFGCAYPDLKAYIRRCAAFGV